MADTVGEADLRAENVSRIVTGFALQEYKMKQVVMIQPSTSWKESYYQEGSAELTGGTGSAIKGIPRGANFPYGEANWTKVNSWLEKYGMEGVIHYEDVMTGALDVIGRTLLRIARAVTNSVDAEIYGQLLANVGNTVTITASYEWDSATIANRDPVQDILNGIKEIFIDNYDALQDGYLLVNPIEYANLLGNSNVRNAGKFYTDDVTRNGRVGILCGLRMIVSNVVTSDTGTLVVKGKECGTWKSAVPLTVVTIYDPGVKWTVRAWEIGVTQVTNPEAVCVITNTAK